MGKSLRTRSIMVGLLLAGAVSSGCSLGRQRAIVPVTTSSDEARDAFLEGRRLQDAFRPEAARVYFIQALRKDSRFPLAHLALAETARTPEEFRSHLRMAVSLRDHASVGEQYMITAADAGARGFLDKQSRRYEALIRLYPDDARAITLYGDQFFERGRHTRAIRRYNEAIDLDHEFAPAYARLGRSYQLRGNYRQAEAAYGRLADLMPSEPNAHRLLGEVKMKTARFEESIESYEDALAADPGFVPARIGIGNDLIFLGRQDEALATFNELHDRAESDEDRRRALLWSAATYLHAEDRAGALQELDRALDVATDGPKAQAEVLGWIGDVLLESGADDEALARYTDALRIMEDATLRPRDKAEARLRHAYHEVQVAIARKDLKTGWSKLREYHRLPTTKGSKARYNELWGTMALAQGDARTALRQLALANRRHPRVSLLMAQAYHQLGQDDKARAACRSAAEFNAVELDFAQVRPRARRLLDEI